MMRTNAYIVVEVECHCVNALTRDRGLRVCGNDPSCTEASAFVGRHRLQLAYCSVHSEHSSY